MKAKKLQKEVVTLKDGRYLIYYSWAKGSEGRGSEGQKVRCLRAEDGGQKAEDERQRTEDRGQRAEDRKA